ncbi:MAG: DUF192 domain-containing protein [Rhodothermales bacterium]|nr:DUF192 domain-containing protein [Rhodothermales bacterium]
MLVIGVLIGACAGDNRDVSDSDVVIPFRVDGTLDFLRNGEKYLSIDIEIADSDSSRVRGMMQRTGFPPSTGMLFVFPVEEIQSFWMANTPVALDIIFADADSSIVSVSKYTKPLSPENVVSRNPARFVLEVPAGFTDSQGIVESDRMRWRRSEAAD